MERFKISLPSAVAVVVTLVILVGSFFWFSVNTDEMVKEFTENYLNMNARSQAAAFNAKISGQIEILDFAQKAFAGIDLKDRDAVSAKIREIGKSGTFSMLAVAADDGILIDGEGRELGNFSKSNFFTGAIGGRSVVSDAVQYDRETKSEYLYIAVPIRNGDSVSGILYGRFPHSVLADLIETVGFQETSTSLLMSSDGTIIARSHGNELVTDRIKNFYDLGTKWGIKGKQTLTSVKLDVKDGRTVSVPYQTGSRDRIAILTPVGMNNWYYAVVISQDVITNQSRVISARVLVVELAISMAFITLLIAIMHLLKSNATIEATNDRFRMATTQTQAVVFDYDFAKQTLILNGNVNFIKKGAKTVYQSDEFEKFMREILHEGDISSLEDFDGIRNGNENSVQREVRILCADGKYYWHRLTASVVRKEDGSAMRLVGNAVNVEDEVNRENMLRRKAEIDPLTGILNKGAFRDYVSKILASATAEDVYAFYIIDLDNFKKVNDTLGHIVGDGVISDMAQKLCMVFSENDYIGRIGGDEFTAFLKLSGSGLQMAQKIIESKAKAICAVANEIYSDEQNEVNVTSSIGVSVFPKNGRTFDELYKNADSVLYESKTGGKNQYHICK